MTRATILALAALISLAGCENRTSQIDVRVKDGSCVRVITEGDYKVEIRTVREQSDTYKGDYEWFPCRLPPTTKPT